MHSGWVGNFTGDLLERSEIKIGPGVGVGVICFVRHMYVYVLEEGGGGIILI